MKQVTVVIPNYNGIRYMEDCLESLYRLEEQELFRVIVVDNGSSDKSPELVREKFPETELIRLQENTGFDHAVNVGISHSDTPYVILLNNDTVVLEGFVRALYECMEKDAQMFSAGAMMLQWQDHGKIDDAGDQYCVLGWAYARGKGKPAERYETPVNVFASCAGAAIYRKSVLEKIGLFDELHFAYLEDIDICYRARLRGYESYYEPKAKVLHAGSATSGSRYNEFKTRLSSANNVYMIGKNMPLLQVVWNLPFLAAGFLVKGVFFAAKGMGSVYWNGLCHGIRLCLSEEGRKQKVKFRWRNVRYYVAVQGMLYRNLIGVVRKK